MSTQTSSISIAWAISQYRQALAAVGLTKRGTASSIKKPTESPEIIRYLRSIGIGRHVDAYA